MQHCCNYENIQFQIIRPLGRSRKFPLSYSLRNDTDIVYFTQFGGQLSWRRSLLDLEGDGTFVPTHIWLGSGESCRKKH